MALQYRALLLYLDRSEMSYTMRAIRHFQKWRSLIRLVAMRMFTTADVMWMAMGILQLRRFYDLVLFQTYIPEFHIGDAA